MRIRTTLAAAAVTTLLAISTTPGSAGAAIASPIKLDRPPTSAEFDSGAVACLLTITGQAKSGEFLHGDPECWLVTPGDRTEPWAQAQAQAQADLELAVSLGVGRGIGLTSASTNVGTHDDGAWYTGSYLTVQGTVCNGGWLTLSWDWVKRISSTRSPCDVYHGDGYYRSGTVEGGSNTNQTYMNNAANSLRYP